MPESPSPENKPKTEGEQKSQSSALPMCRQTTIKMSKCILLPIWVSVSNSEFWNKIIYSTESEDLKSKPSSPVDRQCLEKFWQFSNSSTTFMKCLLCARYWLGLQDTKRVKICNLPSFNRSISCLLNKKCNLGFLKHKNTQEAKLIRKRSYISSFSIITCYQVHN